MIISLIVLSNCVAIGPCWVLREGFCCSLKLVYHARILYHSGKVNPTEIGDAQSNELWLAHQKDNEDERAQRRLCNYSCRIRNFVVEFKGPTRVCELHLPPLQIKRFPRHTLFPPLSDLVILSDLSIL